MSSPRPPQRVNPALPPPPQGEGDGRGRGGKSPGARLLHGARSATRPSPRGGGGAALGATGGTRRVAPRSGADNANTTEPAVGQGRGTRPARPLPHGVALWYGGGGLSPNRPTGRRAQGRQGHEPPPQPPPRRHTQPDQGRRGWRGEAAVRPQTQKGSRAGLPATAPHTAAATARRTGQADGKPPDGPQDGAGAGARTHPFGVWGRSPTRGGYAATAPPQRGRARSARKPPGRPPGLILDIGTVFRQKRRVDCTT